jgi:hypothetical protein
MPARVALRNSRLSREARRALEFLAVDRHGATERLMLAQGFTRGMLVGLVRSGLATRYRSVIRTSRKTVEIAYMTITVSGRNAIERGSSATV